MEGGDPIEEELSEQMEETELDEDFEAEEDAEVYYDNSDLVFDLHEGSVFVVEIDPKHGSLAVSGGEDDKAFVWEISTGNVMLECTGHKDSVTCATFSPCGTMVATGDMSGLVKVWGVESKQEIWSSEASDLEWLSWHPVAPVLMAGTEDGTSWMWKVPSGDCKTFESPGCSCTCGKFLKDGKSAIFGYNDGTVRCFNLKTGEINFSLTKGYESHRGGVTSIDLDPEGEKVITSSQDGTAKLINVATGKVSVSYQCYDRKSDEINTSVECVKFSTSLPYAATACLNGNAEIWDLKSGNSRHKCIHPMGVSMLRWDADGKNILTGCLDGIVRLWNGRNGEILNTFVGHTDEIYDISINKEVLLSASSDGSVRVYQL